MKRFTCTLLTVSALLIGSTSAVLAGEGASGTVQQSSQVTTNQGNDNTSMQTNMQNCAEYRRDANGKTVCIQDAQQDSLNVGDRNYSDTYNRQDSTTIREGVPDRPSR